MKKMNYSRAILGYLQHKIITVILFSAFIILCALIFYLYDLPSEPLMYIITLMIFFMCTALVYGCTKFVIRHKQLYELRENIIYGIESIPNAADMLEEDYQELLSSLFKYLSEINLKTDNEKRDMLDYFTLWVHQIKTPIAAMSLLLQEEVEDCNEELMSELFKIEQYVEMVLSYLRINSQTNDFIIHKSNINNIARQAVRKYAKHFIRKKLILDYNVFDTYILTDEKWLLFVIEQILSNALKYTENGGISIYMEDSDFLVIEDTGVGIDEEDIPRIFENGFTGYNGRTDKKSTGLGLYLCKKIVKKLSHTIKVESIAGKGTKIIIGFKTADISVE